jgi:hypothetical protein
MNHRLLILFALLLMGYTALAKKEDNKVSGKVIDNHNNAVVSASVVLLTGKDTLVKAAFTDEQGAFYIEGISNGAYVLRIILEGFDTHTQKVLVLGNTKIPDITFSEKSTTLNEVSVRAKKPFIEVHADKLVVNVENSIISAGASAMEVLQRSPGVTVDNNENISLKGKQGVMIWINGKQTPMAGADLANVLKSMPANSIEKIEIISNPGARYDAAGTAGIINIILKKDQRIGANGSINLSYGQGVYSKYGAGANLNYRNKKFNLYASYNYSKRIWFNHLMLNRMFLDSTNNEQQLFRYDQDNNAVFDFKNHIATVGVDYSVTSKTTIGISGNAVTNSFNPKANNFSKALGANDELLYRFNTTGRHDNFYYNYSGNGYVKHRFDSAGKELEINLDYAAFGNQSNQNFMTTYQYIDVNQSQPDYYLKSDLTGITQIRSVKADYTNPVKGNARIEAGIKSSFVTADNEPIFQVKTTGAYVVDSSRTNHFIYNENINAAYLNVNKDAKRFSAQLGVRIENTNIRFEQTAAMQKFDTSYSYTQLFPSLAFQYHLDKINDIGLTLSRRIERPNYQQLNPFKYFIDRTTYREGYPRLNPASFYSMELSHTYKQKFITTFTYGVNKGIITEVIQPSDVEDSVTVQTNKNLDKMVFAGISGSYSFSITKWWSNVTNFNAYYAHYEANIANTPLNDGKPSFDINTNNTFLLPGEFSAELGGWYQARQLYGYMDVQPNWMLNAGIQKTLFNKQATLRLNIQDIFWTGYPRATSVYTGYREDFIAERETRVANISFTYRFGKKTVPQTRRHSSGAEEEKRRANQGGA